MKKYVYYINCVLGLILKKEKLIKNNLEQCLKNRTSNDIPFFLIKLLLRFSKHDILIDLLQGNSIINKELKTIISAIILRHLKKYKESYKLLEEVDTEEKHINKIKCLNLYNLRYIEELLEFSKKVKINQYLTMDQKKIIVKYSFNKNCLNTTWFIVKLNATGKMHVKK